MGKFIKGTIILFYLLSLANPCIVYCGLMVNSGYIAAELCEMRDIPDNCCKGSCYVSNELNSDDSAAATGKRISPKTENFSPHITYSNSLLSDIYVSFNYSVQISHLIEASLKPSTPPTI